MTKWFRCKMHNTPCPQWCAEGTVPWPWCEGPGEEVDAWQTLEFQVNAPPGFSSFHAEVLPHWCETAVQALSQRCGLPGGDVVPRSLITWWMQPPSTALDIYANVRKLWCWVERGALFTSCGMCSGSSPLAPAWMRLRETSKCPLCCTCACNLNIGVDEACIVCGQMITPGYMIKGEVLQMIEDEKEKAGDGSQTS